MIQEIRIMRGPNMWSSKYNQVIAIKFDPVAIPEYDLPQQQSICNYFSTKYGLESQHKDFITCIFRFSLQLAAQLQNTTLHYDLSYPTKGVVFGIIEYEIEEAGVTAIKLAAKMVKCILANEEPLGLEEAIEEVAINQRRYAFGISTSLIIEAAKKRNIPVTMGPAGYIVLGYGKKQQKISAAMSSYTSCIGVNIAGNKDHTKKFLESANIPVSKGMIIRDENELMEVANRLEYPLVTKPFNGNQGRNITCDIINFENLLTGFRYAKEASRAVIIEKEIVGRDYRLLVIGNTFCAASLRLPAFIVGNGQLTVADLVAIENKNPQRGDGHQNILTKITLDAPTELCLQKQGYSTSCVPAFDKTVFLKLTANLSTGGTAEDVTDLVHPETILLAEKVSRIIGLDICGIDIISQDISTPLTENSGAVIEVNAAPGLRMHKYPSKGLSREVGGPIVDLMFKEGNEGRIPIIAITGTNGKTTTTRLMAHIAASVGYTVGFSSTDGIYVNGHKVQSGDCSGPQSARTILIDTTTDFAVLECARGGIIRSGLGFDQCDIGIVTNVAADHLGLKDINTVEDLAVVKAVVPAAVKENGWVILNASDAHALAMSDKVKCKVALFSSDENNLHLREHIAKGGRAVYADHKLDIYVCNESAKIFIINAADVPLTRNGKAGFMIDNVLPVVLAARLSGIQRDKIVLALKSFIPSAEQTPGRINEFKINGVNVILDYAHNPHGLKGLAGYLKNIPTKKIGIITGTGNRRDEDIIEFGRISAAMYDEFIIRLDRDLRGRTQEDIVSLVAQGLHEIKPKQTFQVIPDLQTALEFAVNTAEKGSYVILCADNATLTVEIIKKVILLYENS